MTHRLSVRLLGPLLVGGDRRGHTIVTLRTPNGEPYIPGSALKGAIREQLQRLHGRTLADEILGTSGPAVRFDGGSTRVHISDAHASPDAVAQYCQGLGYALRTRVAIDRATRRAADQRLFAQEVVEPRDTGVFEADIDLRLLDEGQRHHLATAIASVFALGAGRSGGLGAIEMALHPAEEPAPMAVAATDVPEAESLLVVLEAVDPLCLGGSRQNKRVGNFHRSSDFIAAPTLRGALVAAAMRARGVHADQTDDPVFRRVCLDATTCLRISDALPFTNELPAIRMPVHAPHSLRACRNESSHGAIDTLVPSWLQGEAARRGLFWPATDQCPTCGLGLKAASGWLGATKPGKRVVTRVGLDVRLGRAFDGQLFSLEVLEPGTRFVAIVSGLDSDGRALLRDAAREGLRVGRGRGQGYGRVRVATLVPAPDDDLAPRLAAFDDAVQRLQTAFEAEVEPLGVTGGPYLSALLLTDMVPAAGVVNAEQALLAALELPGFELLAGQVRSGHRGGYDTRAAAQSQSDTPKAFVPVVQAGASLLLRGRGGWSDALREHLATLERRGIGTRREEGFGAVRFSDAVHHAGWRQA